MATPLETFKTTAQCAEYLGISTATYRRLVRNGRISAQFKSPTRFGSYQADLDAYLAKGRQEVQEVNQHA